MLDDAVELDFILFPVLDDAVELDFILFPVLDDEVELDFIISPVLDGLDDFTDMSIPDELEESTALELDE